MRRLLLLTTLLLLSCSDSSLSPGQQFEPPVTRLYVKNGGSGDGRTAETPASTISAALNTAYLDPNIEEIFIAGGNYIESMRIRSSVTISGSRDPNNGWAVSGPRTVIQGRSIDTLGIACLILNLSRRVGLENLDIKGPNPPGNGASTIVLYTDDVDSLYISNCNLIAGNGKSGANGIRGTDGTQGANAVRALPGVTPTEGGEGGAPGPAVSTAQQPGEPGEIGDCGGIGTGGSGGTGGINGNGGPGGRGSDGLPGADGNGGLQLVTLEPIGNFLFPLSEEADSGVVGYAGCGGGGGGGSASVWNPNFTYVGTKGGGAGSGGFGGTAGGPGQAGGHSIGILALRSSVTLTSSTVISGSGGNGGNGGEGGIGGPGGLGDGNPSVIYSGGRGGDGGTGGKGGYGGGGAGGWNVAIILSSSTITNASSTLTVGTAGIGGVERSAGNGGAAGVATTMHEISPGL